MISYHLFEVEIFIDSDWNAPLFTGKLVKSLLIDSNPNMKQIFEKSSGIEPKLIHISPLYEVNNGKIRCIYSQVKHKPIKGDGKRSKASPIQLKGKYKFYVGFVESRGLDFNTIFNTIMNLSGKHIFSNHVFNVEVLGTRTIDVDRYAQNIVWSLIGDSHSKSGETRLRIIFSSPTLLRDPFRSAKHKSLVATPINIFSTPIYIYLHLVNRLRQKELYSLAILMHRLFNEAHTIHDTVKKVWIFYESNKNQIPAIIGYVNLHLNHDYYKKYSKKYQLEDFLTEIFKIMITLGTGTSRATGFGHIILESTGEQKRLIRHLMKSEEFSGRLHKDF